MSGTEALWVPLAMGAMGGIGGALGSGAQQQSTVGYPKEGYQPWAGDVLKRGLGNLEHLGAVLAERAAAPVTLPGAYVAPTPWYGGGGLAMPVGTTAMDPALIRPALLGQPGVRFAGANQPFDTEGKSLYKSPAVHPEQWLFPGAPRGGWEVQPEAETAYWEQQGGIGAPAYQQLRQPPSTQIVEPGGGFEELYGALKLLGVQKDPMGNLVHGRSQPWDWTEGVGPTWMGGAGDRTGGGGGDRTGGGGGDRTGGGGGDRTGGGNGDHDDDTTTTDPCPDGYVMKNGRCVKVSTPELPGDCPEGTMPDGAGGCIPKSSFFQFDDPAAVDTWWDEFSEYAQREADAGKLPSTISTGNYRRQPVGLNEVLNETLFNQQRRGVGDESLPGMTKDQARWYAQERYNNPYDQQGLARTIVDLEMGEDWSPYDDLAFGGSGPQTQGALASGMTATGGSSDGVTGSLPNTAQYGTARGVHQSRTRRRTG